MPVFITIIIVINISYYNINSNNSNEKQGHSFLDIQGINSLVSKCSRAIFA